MSNLAEVLVDIFDCEPEGQFFVFSRFFEFEIDSAPGDMKVVVEASALRPSLQICNCYAVVVAFFEKFCTKNFLNEFLKLAIINVSDRIVGIIVVEEKVR